MLPDFPHLKTKLSKFLDARMKSVHNRATPFSRASAVCIQEGNCTKMIRADGTEETIEMKHHHTEVRISDEELENLSSEEIQRKFDEAAREMANQMTQTCFESLNKAISEVGNAVRYTGMPTVEDIFRMYETIDIDFDECGKPELPTLMCGRKMMEHLQALHTQIESDPETNKRFVNLMIRKKEEWRDREASRRLVG